MKFKPVITEKSMRLAEEGKYTFKVGKSLNKHKIKRLISEAFDVHVTGVRTINYSGGVRTTPMRRKKVIKPYKKAIVTLREKEKIDVFEKAKK